MNFYKHFIGDYQRDTGHLSLVEHGAYRLMLDAYYATAKPLPVGDGLYRLLRATTRDERAAVDSVLKQFWRETSEGMVNVRADEELAKAAIQAEANRRVAIAREEKRRENKPGTNRITFPKRNDNGSSTT